MSKLALFFSALACVSASAQVITPTPPRNPHQNPLPFPAAERR